jgi:hypothetical protein
VGLPCLEDSVSVARLGSSGQELSAVVAALIGAVVGGLLTLAGDLGAREWSDRRRFRRLAESLRQEVEAITNDARIRQGAPSSAGLRLLPPLPVVIWDEFLALGLLGRLRPDQSDALVQFYRAVHEANYMASQAPSFLLIANIAADDGVRRAFADEAQRITSEPYAAVEEQSQPAIRHISHASRTSLWRI